MCFKVIYNKPLMKQNLHYDTIQSTFFTYTFLMCFFNLRQEVMYRPIALDAIELCHLSLCSSNVIGDVVDIVVFLHKTA